jgi:hypothetical protein
MERWWVSWAEQLERDAEERGRKAERERWLGKLRRQMLSSLGIKFGELPEEIVQRVQHASEEDLDRLVERLPDAPALADLFG